MIVCKDFSEAFHIMARKTCPGMYNSGQLGKP